MIHLTARELEVLSVLWNSDNPMTITDIVNSEQDLTQSTVNAVLRKLLSLNLIEISGVARSGKTLSRTYTPTPSSKDVILQYLADSYNKFNKTISKSAFFVTLLKNSDDNQKNKEEEINKIKDMLERFERDN